MYKSSTPCSVVETFNERGSVQQNLHYGIVIFACSIVANEEVVFKKGDTKGMPKQQSDSARWSSLMVRAQQGSESDYQQLLTELANVIHAYLRKRFGNQPFLEDCVQESLLAIHKARHTYDPQRPFRPWFFTIVRHKMIDYLRHKKSYQRVIKYHQQEKAVREQQVKRDMMEDTIDNDNLLGELPPRYRMALTLTKLAGFTNAEAAKQLGISEGAVKVRVYRAINKLRQIIEAED